MLAGGLLGGLPRLLATCVCFVIFVACAGLVQSQEAGGETNLPPMTKYPPNPDCPCLSQQEVAARVQAGNAAADAENAAGIIMGSNSCPDGMLASTIQKKSGPQLLCLHPKLGSEVCRAWDSVLEEVGSIEDFAC